MLVFIDESGDPGFKLDSGSSHFFVVTMIVFDDHKESQKVDDQIAILRNKLGIRSDHEFHFNKLNRLRRERFLKEVSLFQFKYFSIVIDKKKLTNEGHDTPTLFYKYACTLVCLSAKEILSNSIIVIDGQASREFKNQLAAYLKKNTNEPGQYPPRIKKVKLRDSKNNNLIQLADMVCGAVARSFSKKSDADFYRNLLKKQESRVQIWPK